MLPITTLCLIASIAFLVYIIRDHRAFERTIAGWKQENQDFLALLADIEAIARDEALDDADKERMLLYLYEQWYATHPRKQVKW